MTPVLEATLEPSLLWDDNSVKVWLAPLNLPPSALQTLRQTLSADERERAARYRLPHMADAFTVRRGLLRVLLGRELGCFPDSLRFAANSLGKPILAANDGSFSVSSSHDYAVWAFSRAHPVGVDIEWIDPAMPLSALINDHFSQAEKKRLNALTGQDERATAFFRAWTVKESCAKATGIGLSAPLNRYAVLDASAAAINTLSRSYKIASLQFPPKPKKAEYWVSLALALCER